MFKIAISYRDLSMVILSHCGAEWGNQTERNRSSPLPPSSLLPPPPAAWGSFHARIKPINPPPSGANRREDPSDSFIRAALRPLSFSTRCHRLACHNLSLRAGRGEYTGNTLNTQAGEHMLENTLNTQAGEHMLENTLNTQAGEHMLENTLNTQAGEHMLENTLNTQAGEHTHHTHTREQTFTC